MYFSPINLNGRLTYSVGSGSKSCRILFIVGQLGLGGYERQLFYLLRTMDRECYRPAVAVWNYRDKDEYVGRMHELGVPVYTFSSVTSAIGKLLSFRRMVRKLKPEIVQSYSFYTNLAASYATCGTSTIPIGSVRSDFSLAKRDTGPIVGRLSACWPRAQISNNRMAAQTAQTSRDLFVPKRLFVARNGVDLDQFRASPIGQNQKSRILGVGSLVPVKRWDRLIGAALSLRRKGYQFQIQIAGQGPMRAFLEQQVRDAGLAEVVEFLGAREDIPQLLSDAAFLAHTSDAEGCPNVIMEAMASARAVVATDAGDVIDLVEDGKTGFVVRRGDDRALVERLMTLLNDYDLCERMGKAARVKAEQEFGLDRLVSQTFAAYRAAGWKDK